MIRTRVRSRPGEDTDERRRHGREVERLDE
jgi:hypothetical protein